MSFSIGPCEQHDSGLELAICQPLVALMGGDLSLASQPEQGNFYRFLFPSLVPEKETGRGKASGKGSAVLLALSDPKERESVEALLAGWGYCPSSVGSGREALAELMRAVVGGQSFDLVLAEDSLPDLPARDLVDGIRAVSGFSGRLALLRHPLGDQASDLPDTAVLQRPLLPEHIASLLSLQLPECPGAFI